MDKMLGQTPDQIQITKQAHEFLTNQVYMLDGDKKYILDLKWLYRINISFLY